MIVWPDPEDLVLPNTRPFVIIIISEVASGRGLVVSDELWCI